MGCRNGNVAGFRVSCRFSISRAKGCLHNLCEASKLAQSYASPQDRRTQPETHSVGAVLAKQSSIRTDTQFHSREYAISLASCQRKRSTAQYPTCTLTSDMGALVTFPKHFDCLETWTQKVSRLSLIMVSFALCFLGDRREIRALSTILDSVGKVNRIDGLAFEVTERFVQTPHVFCGRY